MTSFSLKSIQKGIEAWGWQVLGVVPSPPEGDDPLVILLGNAGPQWWAVFKTCPEYRDRAADPMDRAAKRLGDSLAKQINCKVVYPSDGPPYQPFLRWAQASGQAFSSPLGPLVHQRYGLWHAYRAALLVDDPKRVTDLTQTQAADMTSARSPCKSCQERPCLTSCPVSAIGQGRYNIPDCLGYLEAQPADCLAQGCAARRACPVGEQHLYTKEQASFHMRAFLMAQRKRLR